MTYKLIQHIQREPTQETEEEDQYHPLLKDHSFHRSYTTDVASYQSIRVFYHRHAHAEKLKAISDLPLLVFIHGLGGTLPQFAPLLSSLITVASCFGIELPGHGHSDFNPTDYAAYTTDAFVLLWKAAIEDICVRNGHDKVILICHSMGGPIGALLASTTTSTHLNIEVCGMIALCPKAIPPTKSQAATFSRILALPDLALDVLRWFDGRGAEDSRSVRQFVGEAAGIDLRRLQLKYNRGFKTPVWKRAALGCLPAYDKDDTTHGGIPGRSVWRGVRLPLFLIAGEADTVTPPEEITHIISYLRDEAAPKSDTKGSLVPNSENQSSDQLKADSTDTKSLLNDQDSNSHANDTRYGVAVTSHNMKSNAAEVVKTVILPSPASHALMYDHATYRTVAGLIEDFFSHHIPTQPPGALSLGWQLQQLTTSGKWDVKNLEKWQKVTAVSGPIDGGILRALKTLREQDEEHTPSVFLKRWTDKIFAVVDISHDSPIYDTKALERGGVQYHKFPTISKVPPTTVEVRDFIALIDRLRLENEAMNPDANPDRPLRAIAVHCHYGYNRTGFFIVCYLVEKRGYTVEEAIKEFAKHKPPGIRHEHFIDTLYVRYCVGLKKAPTVLPGEKYLEN